MQMCQSQELQPSQHALENAEMEDTEVPHEEQLLQEIKIDTTVNKLD